MNTSGLLDLLQQTKKYQSHRRKIQSIMTKSSHSLSFRKKDAVITFQSSREKANRFSNKMKQQEVDKQNDLILKKIIDVNRRSHQSHQLNHSSQKDLSHNHLSNLRKKLSQTNEDNQKLATKLVSTTSKLCQNLLSEDNRRYAQIKQRLKKYTYDQETGMVIPKQIKSLVRLSKLDPLRQNYNSRVENDERE